MLRTILFSFLLSAPLLSLAQMIPNQSVEILYDARGNRIVRQPIPGSSNKKSEEGMTLQKKDEAFSFLSPNPAKNETWINLNDTSSCSLKIYDFRGKLLYNDQINGIKRKRIDVSYLAPGSYIVIVESTRQVDQSTLVKY